MGKPNYIELGDKKHIERIPIVYEDRSVLAIDKPPGWMLVPFTWQKTNRNLQAAIVSSIAAKDYWARSRSLKFLRYVHRLDAETSGILLFAKSLGAVDTFGDMFESRRMEKIYLAVASGVPKQTEWTCTLKLAPDPKQTGRMRGTQGEGKDAETHFKVLESRTEAKLGPISLIEARPTTGRTHQIRVHLAESGHPIVGDFLYGNPESPSKDYPLGLRAVFLSYTDPFTRQKVKINAPTEHFIKAFRFTPRTAPLRKIETTPSATTAKPQAPPPAKKTP